MIGGRRPTLEYACAAARVKGHAKLWRDDSEDEETEVIKVIARKAVRSKDKHKRKGPQPESTMDVDNATPRARSQRDLNLSPNPNPDLNTNTNPSTVNPDLDVGGDTETEMDMETETEQAMRSRHLSTHSIVALDVTHKNDNVLANDEDDEDEDEAHEAITPHSSQGSLDGSRRGVLGKTRAMGKGKAVASAVVVGRDDDMMDAALALCGLSGR